MKKCVIVYNEKSGRIKSDKIIDTFHEVIDKYDYSLEVKTTKRKGHATTIVKNLSDDVDLVISAGGDGTFNECIKGNMLREKKLLMSNLPVGTTNDVATMYGLTGGIKDNLELIFNGTKKNIDILMINNCPFIYVAAFGNFINVTFDTPKRLKETFGKLGYIMYGFTEITERIRMNHIKYEIDGVEKEGDYSFMFITNSTRVGGVNNLYKDVKLDDNKFEVVLCNLNNKADIALAGIHILTKGIDDSLKGCECFSTSNIKIKFDKKPGYSWGIDGEEFKSNSKEFNFTINKEISLLLPNSNIDKLFIKK